MRHRNAGYKLGRLTQHRWALFRNLLVALFRHERIATTDTKARAVRGLAEHMITLAKREDLHARRQVLSMVPDTEVVGRLFDTIAARFADRNGGYTRIIKTGPRPGDGAPMVFLELVDRAEAPTDKDKKSEKKERAPKGEAGATGRRPRKDQAAAAPAWPASAPSTDHVGKRSCPRDTSGPQWLSAPRGLSKGSTRPAAVLSGDVAHVWRRRHPTVRHPASVSALSPRPYPIRPAGGRAPLSEGPGRRANQAALRQEPHNGRRGGLAPAPPFDAPGLHASTNGRARPDHRRDHRRHADALAWSHRDGPGIRRLRRDDRPGPGHHAPSALRRRLRRRSPGGGASDHDRGRARESRPLEHAGLA